MKEKGTIAFSVLYELGNAFKFQCKSHLVKEERHNVLGITSDAVSILELFIHNRRNMNYNRNSRVQTSIICKDT